jgi:fumarylacetoacetase
MNGVDVTHDPGLRSWVESANVPGTDFPIQNLPFGRFRRKLVEEGTGRRRRRKTDESWRIGVAIGDQVLDLRLAAEQCPWDPQVLAMLEPLGDGHLKPLMAMEANMRRKLRFALSAALSDGSMQGPFLELCLVPQTQTVMSMPCEIGDYTDFFTGIHHARAVGQLFRPDTPLMPNYTWVPIAYHGRASSIGLSGGGVVRPNGQIKKREKAEPVFGPTRSLDYELELGVLVGRGNELGAPKTMVQADEDWFGMVLLNDWSARDVQAWEYQPLGPFLAKSFATTISPWIVTREALAPFRCALERPADSPPPLPYLDSPFNREQGQIDITLGVWLHTAAMRERGDAPVRLSQSNMRDSWWTVAQMLAHHTSNGCNLQAGDLLGTGTLSGPKPEQAGSLLELTAGGKRQLSLPGGETRTFLQDGDCVILRAVCERAGAAPIGFGLCEGTVLPAVEWPPKPVARNK